MSVHVVRKRKWRLVIVDGKENIHFFCPRCGGGTILLDRRTVHTGNLVADLQCPDDECGYYAPGAVIEDFKGFSEE